MTSPSNSISISSATDHTESFWINIIFSLPNKFRAFFAFSDDKASPAFMSIPSLAFKLRRLWTRFLSFNKTLSSEMLHRPELIFFFLVVMHFGVLGSCSYDQVGWTVIILHAVYVMDYFRRFKFSSEDLTHNDPVFRGLFAFVKQFYIIIHRTLLTLRLVYQSILHNAINFRREVLPYV